MAFTPRTIEEIETAMLADKEARTELNALTSTSNVSVWRNMIFAFAASTSLHENAFADFQSNVEQRSFEIQAGTDRWYAAESLIFQFGDQLEIVNNVVTYPVIDEEKQIIEFAASDKEAGRLIIKVAKKDDNGLPTPLTAAELAAFTEYWDKKQFACTPIGFRSQAGDIAQVTYRVGVDSTLLNPVNGESLDEPGKFPVIEAVTTHLQIFQLRNFSGLFRVAELTDAIQAVPGVINAVANDIQIKPFDGTFVDVLQDQNQEYNARAGYIVIDPATPLGGTITYY